MTNSARLLFIKHVSTYLRSIAVGVVACVILFAPTASAIDSFYSGNDIQFYDPDDSSVCSESNNAITSVGTDYKGQPILTDSQKSAISANQSVYEEAANEADIPWQLIAVIHLRESGLGRSNPSNGQGIYQFVNKNGGPYPTGAVDDAEFLRQTKLAAQFIKGKASSNLTQNRSLTKSASADTIKDTLFSYNGRASVYAEQAARVGFDSATQPFEGSPYVMNTADEKRDPAVNTSSWGQIKHDFGGIEYPANNGYGAYVIYASIAGIQSSNCSGSSVSGTVREKVVTIATQELQLWDSKQMSGNGSDFKKYTHGQSGNWCAWFVSWVYKQAGYPLNNSETGAVPAVATVKTIGETGGNFEYHDKNGYTPQVGDITVYKNNGASHVNIVTAVAPDGKITIIGGNQGYGSSAQAVTNFTNSLVTSHSLYVKDEPKISGFVSPKG